jgi:antitoxin component YwqK of YwqJK toxin-antitoxin module
MRLFLLLLLLYTSTIFAIEFGVDQFDEAILENAIPENQLHEDDGICYFLSKPFTGVKKAFHENGKLALAESFRNGLRDGFSYAWYDDGSKKQEFYYLQGQKHGLCYTWYKNGNMQMMANLVRGRFSGQFKAYDQDGYLHFEMYRVDDSLQEEQDEQRELIDGDGKESSRDF